MSDRPITLVDQYRMEAILMNVQRLSDLGIRGPDCRVKIIRYGIEGPHPVQCLKFDGHEGDHETE